jgi:hypothetical protein
MHLAMSTSQKSVTCDTKSLAADIRIVDSSWSRPIECLRAVHSGSAVTAGNVFIAINRPATGFFDALVEPVI